MVLLSILKFSVHLKHEVCDRGISKVQLDWSGWAEKLQACMSDHRKR